MGRQNKEKEGGGNRKGEWKIGQQGKRKGGGTTRQTIRLEMCQTCKTCLNRACCMCLVEKRHTKHIKHACLGTYYVFGGRGGGGDVFGGRETHQTHKMCPGR